MAALGLASHTWLMRFHRTGQAAVVVAILLVVAINALGLPLRTDAAPLGIVSLQLALSVEVADSVLASWGDVGIARILLVHGLDVLLPFAYATAIRSSAARLAVGPASAAAIVAAVADQTENTMMAVSILSAPTAIVVGVTIVAAMVKWGLLAYALLTLGRGWSAARRRAAVA